MDDIISWTKCPNCSALYHKLSENGLCCKCEKLEQKMVKYKVPTHTIEEINRYVRYRVPTGGFLEAVLSNNLKWATAQADDGNLAALSEIVRYCRNEIPNECWGSVEKVDLWLSGNRK